MSNVKVSVIIPVYNCENYLRECLDSVINQTLTNIEVIIINDASNDGSQSIINEYLQSDARIHSIQLNENSGVGVARNIGIEQAIGEYIIFLDADDYWTDSGMLNYLCDIAHRDSSDFTIFGYYRFSHTGQKIISSMGNPGAIDLRINKYWYFNYSVCNLLILREVIYKRNIRFDPKLVMGEDTVFSCKLYCYADKLSITDKIFYCYRTNPTGANYSSWSSYKFFCTAFWSESAINVIKDSPAYIRRPELLQLFIQERLVRLTTVLAFMALKILDEKELREYIEIWARCFAHLNRIYFDKKIYHEGWPYLQQETLNIVRRKDPIKFRELFAGKHGGRQFPLQK